MARTRRSREESPTRPSLVVPRSEAEAKVTAQIQRGKEIFEAHRRGELDDDNADIEKDKWTNYNKELLQRLFDDDKPAREYSRAANTVFTEFSGNPLWGEPDPRLGRNQTDEEIEAYINALDDLSRRLELFPETVALSGKHGQGQVERGSEVFIVHGHDEGAKNTVARFIEKIGLKPIILHEQPDDGRTLIEKFEHYSRVGFAVILMTPDDVGAPVTSPENLHPRARQNVILELGFFLGKLERRFVRALYVEGVEMPSDYDGVLYIPMDSANAWRLRLAGELKAAGFVIDLNRAI